MKKSSAAEERVAMTSIRFANADRLKRAGANMYRVLIARLTDEKTGKLGEDPVIYAICAAIKKSKEAKSFFLGYAKDIRRNPKRHPEQAQKNPREYARTDIILTLNLLLPVFRTHYSQYLMSRATYKLWVKAIRAEKIRPNW